MLVANRPFALGDRVVAKGETVTPEPKGRRRDVLLSSDFVREVKRGPGRPRKTDTAPTGAGEET